MTAGAGSRPAPLGERFWRLFAAYTATTVGDELYVLGVPLVLLQLGYSPASATFLRGALVATTVVAGFTVGWWVDRSATNVLLTRAYGVSAAVLVVACAGLAAGVDGFAVSVVAATVLGLFAAVTAAAVDAGIPRSLGERGQVRRGYSLVESARTVSQIAGPAAAGVLAAARSLLLVTAVNAATFLAAAVLTARGSRSAAPAGERAATGAAASPWASIREGLAAVGREPGLRVGIYLSLLVNLTLGAEQPLFLARMLVDFDVGPGVTAAVVAVAGGVGIVASTLVVRHAREVRASTAMLVGVVVVGASGAGLGLAGGPVAASVLYCTLSAGTISYTVFWRSYRQDITEPALLGRVSAACRSIAYAGVVVGVLAIGALQESGVGEDVLLAAGGGVCLLGVAALARVVRGNERVMAA